MVAVDSPGKSRPRNPGLNRAQLEPIRGSEENFQWSCATGCCATWKISLPQKVPLFGRAAFFRPRTLCTKQMHGATGHALEAIDKSELAHPEPRRIRDKDHLRFVSTQPCLICGR
jgi:hypothetical protein